MLYNKLEFLKYILLPFQIIYAIIIFARNKLYDFKIIKTFHAPAKIVSIGNLNTGGTGKTPMTEYLITLFQDQRVAILSRGYKRKTTGFIIANPTHSAADLGDEACQLYNKFPNALIACDSNRSNGVKQILKQNNKIDIIILDDGFQHRRLNRDINILLTDYSDLFINDQLLPVGRLRESKKEYKRADIIIITKCQKNISNREKEAVQRNINLKDHQKIYFSYIKEYRYICQLTQKEIELNTHETHILLTGIANSKHILNYLNTENINLKHFKFPDHYNLQNNDIKQMLILKDNISKNLLLTEKDYYRLSTKNKKKLQNNFNLICIQIEFDIIDNQKSNFKEELLNFKKSKTYSK
tara:strand:+ start:179 stop:1243 length:1065 start_codon:yes stop_codon:yes gene_type:complete